MTRNLIKTKVAAAIGVAATLVAGTLVVFAVPAVAATTHTWWYMSGDSDDPITKGVDYQARPADSDMGPPQGAVGISLSIESNPRVDDPTTPEDNGFSAYFLPPAGQDLQVGTYNGVTVAGNSPVSGHASMRIEGRNRSCDTVSGSFTVIDLDVQGDGTVTSLAISYVQHCNGSDAAAYGMILYDSESTGAAMTLTAPAGNTPAGTKVTLTGHLFSATGPLKNTHISVTRTDAGGSAGAPMQVTTNSKGTFSLKNTLGTKNARYHATYGGNPGKNIPAAETSHLVTVGAVSTKLTIHAAAKVARAHQTTVKGVLTSGGSPISGATVKLTRHTLAGSTSVKRVTSASGAWSYSYKPAVGGKTTYSAHWAGDGTRGSADSKTVTTKVSRAATTLTLKRSAPTVGYGKKVTVRIHLGKTYNGHIVTVYAYRKGTVDIAPGNLVANRAVNGKGDLVVHRTITNHTTFTVSFAGDSRYAPVKKTLVVHARASARLSLSGWHRHANGYYRYTDADPVAAVKVLPKRPGSHPRVTVQVWHKGTWRPQSSARVSLGSASTGRLTFLSPRAEGAKYRIRVSVKKNGYSYADSSPWRYFTFT